MGIGYSAPRKVTAADLADGAVTAAKLAGGAVTAAKVEAPLLASFRAGISDTLIAATYTDAPAGDTEDGPTFSRVLANLSDATEFRYGITQRAIGAAGSRWVVQFFAGGAWNDLSDAIAAGVAGGNSYMSAWLPLPAAARLETALLRLIHRGGNGVADPGAATWSFHWR